MGMSSPITYVCIRDHRTWVGVPLTYYTLDMCDFRRALIQYIPKQRLGAYRDVHQLGVL